MPARAQNAGGRIVGTVFDQQGSVVPGAKVTVTNTLTSVSNTTTTDQEGFFQVLELPVGIYRVTVEHAGFRKTVTQNKKLEINASLRFDITLELGTTTQTVTVEAKVSGVETVSPTLGQEVTSRAVQDLPLNGRDVLALALLQPGVTEANPDYTGATTQGGFAFSIAGGRPDSITFLLDGGLNNNLLDNSNVLDPNPDAISEFRLLTSDYTAEYGRNGAGIISVVTKSGTNSIHGTAYDYVRNTDFDANNYFNIIAQPNPLPRNDLKRHQFGATLGGPIVKNRVFWFVSYQGQRQTQTVVSSDVTTFTPQELQGNFSQAVQNGSQVIGPSFAPMTVTCANPQCPDPNVAAFLQANPFFQPNAAMAAQAIIAPTTIDPAASQYIALGVIPTSTTGVVSTAGISKNNNNEITGKMDFVISPNDKLAVTIGGFRNPQLLPFPFGFGANVPGFPIDDKTNNYFGTLAYIRNFTPNFLNELRFTAQRNLGVNNVPATTLPNPNTLGFGIAPDLPDGPPIMNFDTGLNLGNNGEGPATLANNTFALTDTVTWVKGHNTWKFGGGVSGYQNNQLFDFFGNGNFTFDGFGSGGIGTGNSFADFLVGLPNNIFEGANARSDIRSKATYGFFQDEWRVRKNLTLTMGIRYEYSEPKYDTAGRTFDIIPGQQSIVFPNAPLDLVYPGDPGAPRGVNFPVTKNWAPRFGFAWDPWNNGKTSVRGGFGIFYDILKAEDNFQFNGTPPFYSEATGFLPGPVNGPTGYYSQPWTNSGFPADPFPSVPPTPNISFANFLPLGINGIFLVDPHLHTPYTYQYNLSIQHELIKSLVAEVSYVGSSSKGLTALEDINPFVLGTMNRVLNVNQPSPAIQAICQSFSTADCPYASLPAFANVGFANYNSLEASLTRQLHDSRFFGTTYFTFAYTYGRAIDNTSGFQNRTFQVPFYNINQFRGAADYDVQHRITFSGGWDLPFDRAWKSGPSRLTKGWSLYPIFSWRTGFPLSIPGQFSLDPSVPGPSGAGDGGLASASFAPGFDSIAIVNPRKNSNQYFVSSVGGQNVFVSAATAGVAGGYGLPRNFFYGPGRTNLDLALAKTTTIHESVNLQFRVEAFNLFNHAQFVNPDVNILDNTFGQITSTYPERILQLALRLAF